MDEASSAAASDSDHLSGLDRRLVGRLVRPGDADWDQARQAFNLAVDQRPAAVAFPAGADDVAASVDAARAEGLRVAPQRTGHAAQPNAFDGAMLLRTDLMQGVQVDPEESRARVAAGAMWRDLVPAAAEHGLAALHGSAPAIGIVGYSLGGGFGWYARKYGLQANSVTAIELVTADGAQRQVDADSSPDLFWALRGAGGNFGVVTALEFALYPVGEVFSGMAIWPWERSAEVIRAWREITEDAPEELTSVARILQIPPRPEIPEVFRGREIVVVDGVLIGEEGDGKELMQPLLDLDPEMETFAMTAPEDVVHLHMDPPDPLPYASEHRLLDDIRPETIDRLVEVAGPGSGSPLAGVELRHGGGAAGRGGDGHGAIDSFAGNYLQYAAGAVIEPEAMPVVRSHLAKVDEVFEPLDAGAAYWSFLEHEDDASRFFDADTLERLRRVRSEYDPDRMFRANHEI